MMLRLLDPARRRHRLAERTPSGPLADYYAAPVPDGRADWRQGRFLALDLETTGLDARRDAIVSIGWVVIEDAMVDLGRHGHSLVRPPRGVTPESAVIHGIFDADLEYAPPLDAALVDLLAALRGRVLVCHHGRIERGFLDAACRVVYGVGFAAPMVDTLELERRSLRAADRPVARGMLRLDAVRQRYNLPRYHAHNALTDAVAAAELFLAQMEGRGRAALRDVWSW